MIFCNFIRFYAPVLKWIINTCCMKTHKLLLRLLSLILVAFIFILACKKEQEEPLPTPENPRCTIITPGDSSMVQIGSPITIEATITGFGPDVKVAFSIDTAQLSEASSAPYEFTWNTEGWTEGIYWVRADAYEIDKLASDQIRIIIIDTIQLPRPPVPIINITPNTGTTDTLFVFDASESFDPDNPQEVLQYRWDFDGDDSWDTEFTMEHLFQHQYTHPSNYHVKLQVMSSDSMMADTSKLLQVEYSGTMDACQGYVTVPHGGKVYHTVAIGEQCWLRENMNYGLILDETEMQTNNDIPEKFCYDNDSLNCEKYGGLYLWSEMMNYVPFQGVQGICPNGWHIPSDDEWKELEGFTDSQYEIGDPVWDENSYRGFDTGKHLKALLGWNAGGNGDNLYDFKAIPGGFWEISTSFIQEGEQAHFWSSTHDSGHNAAQRTLKDDKNNISRTFEWDETARSVRCIRD